MSSGKSFRKIETALYAERLNAFREDGVDEITTLARYSWNMALSESLYSSLQFAEIALRNSIHAVLTRRFRSDKWYDVSDEWYDEKEKPRKWQSAKVREAREKLRKREKEVTSGRIVAELNFGFWTAFFNKGYHRNGIGHCIASEAFPYAPRSERSLQSLARRWMDIRNLRNRVFHHERIIHLRNLSQLHREIHQVIQWIEPELEALTRGIDRFEKIYCAGVDPWFERICIQIRSG